jgi:predicted Zn-dependent peptidase
MMKQKAIASRTMSHRLLRNFGAIVASTISLAFMSNTISAQVDRTRQPEPGPAPQAAFPHYEEFTLKNGLKVFLVHDDRPLVTFRLQVRGGVGGDGSLPGLSEAAADLLTKGTTSRPAQKFAEQIDFVGGSVNASTSQDAVSVGASGLKKHLKTILDLFADAVKHPAYAADEVAKYKTEQITNLKANKSEPGFLATSAVNKLLYGDTPFGATATEESINSLTPEKLKAYHDTYFLPNNSTLAVVGDFTKEELASTLEAAFGDWAGSRAPALAEPKFPQLSGRRIIIVDRPASVQSSIRVIAKGPSYRESDRPKTFILNSIFGGGTGLGNRLASNLRETHSYTYTPYSYFSSNMYTGNFLAVADVRNEVTDSALAEMIYEIERIQKESVPEDELKRNIQSSVGGFLMSIADPTTTAVRVQSIDFYGLPKDYYERLAGVYSGVTAQDVQSLAKKYINSEDIAVVVVGKASEIKPKLEKFGKVEVWNAELQPAGEGMMTMSSIDGMSADQLWGKMVDAMGGKRKLQAIQALKTTMAVELNAGPQKFNGSIESLEAAPNKKHELVDLGVFKQELWINGSKATRSKMGQVEELSGEELDKQLEEAHILPWAYMQEMGGKLALKGKKEVDGHQTYVVEVTLPKNGAVTYYVDARTFLPYREETAEGQVKTYNDWATVAEGVKMPSALTIEPQPGVTIKASGAKYEINPKFDKKVFEKK